MDTVRVATASLTNSTSWTTVGAVYSTAPEGAGNQFVIKEGSTYYLFYERMSAASWSTGVATSSSPTGPFTSQRYPIMSLQPTGTNLFSAIGIWIGKEGSTFVAYFHSGPNQVGLPTAIYRATSPSLLADSWTISNQGQPIVRRAAPGEVQQIADPFVAKGPGGTSYLVWEGFNNAQPGQGTIYMSPLQPVTKQYDGAYWHVVQSGFDRDIDTLRSDQPVIQIFPWVNAPSKKNGTWLTQLDTGIPAGCYYNNNSNAQGDSYGYDVVPEPGSWRVDVMYSGQPNRAIAAIALDNGVYLPAVGVIGTIDFYQSSGSPAFTVQGLTFTVPGPEKMRRTLWFRAATRNASSTGWFLPIIAIQLRRTDV
jgi:hypothetical protein